MINPGKILIKEYDYALPNERIAAQPLSNRDESKLLIYKNGKIKESIFRTLPDHLSPKTTLVLNNTRVIEARILFQKNTGGVIEIFCLEPAENSEVSMALNSAGTVRWKCLIGGASKWKHGEVLQKEIITQELTMILTATYINKYQDYFIIEFSWQPSTLTFAEVLHASGLIPLPPYIKRKPDKNDAERYQTIFAKQDGSVAAPTAALHFTQNVFDKLKEKDIATNYLTLHVGAGTFKPVKTETIADHTMHAEQFEISTDVLKKIAQSKEIIAVGTTTLRTLESIYWIGIKILNGLIIEDKDLVLEQWESYKLENKNFSYRESIKAVINFAEAKNSTKLICKTSLIIIPGYKFYSAKALLTNFHQPQSTLLLLVAAFIGDDWKNVYQYALENDFRFLSYGDGSFLWRKE